MLQRYVSTISDQLRSDNRHFCFIWGVIDKNAQYTLPQENLFVLHQALSHGNISCACSSTIPKKMYIPVWDLVLICSVSIPGCLQRSLKIENNLIIITQFLTMCYIKIKMYHKPTSIAIWLASTEFVNIFSTLVKTIEVRKNT